MNATTAVPDRVEMTLFDMIRTEFVLKSCISFLIVLMGLTGLATLRRGKALFAQKMFQRMFFTFMVFLIFFVYSRKGETNFKNLVNILQTGVLNDTNIDMVLNHIPIVDVNTTVEIEDEQVTKRLLGVNPLAKTSD